ncbi:hypothetical protein [Methanosarcina sp. WWM596]|uniref:hypothetical protein n=1 Tax=Methanosarcina sp. WWM596 TaxID=1434103 RepID=UPI000615B82B|nr:hypothetical protein [Methanosarcina sp. WWM596]AKB18808.1 hypothetical protein MSWHS_1945 [Methanosarcina sp. WWM596]
MQKSINPHQKRKKTAFMITSLSVLIMALLIISPTAAAVSNWDLSPENPVLGDTLRIKGSASPEEEIEIQATFEKAVPVSGGEYECILEGVKIPEGFENRFTVQASGAKNLNVRVKIVVWVTKSSEASGNTAVVSQSNVPPGTYNIKIDGDAKEGVSNVKLKVTALQGIEADSNGEFSYSYNTKAIPPGDLEIEVGGITKTVTIKSEEDSGSTSGDSSTDDSSTDDSSTDDSSTDDSSTDDSSTDDSSTDDSSTGDSSTDDSSTGDSSTDDSSTGDSSTDDSSTGDSSTDDSSTDSSFSGSSSKETKPSMKPTNSETVKESGVYEDLTSDESLVGGDNQAQLPGNNTQTSEASIQFEDKFYLLAGMVAGLLILIVYLRKK